MSLFRLDTFSGKIVAFSLGLLILAGIVLASIWGPFSLGTQVLPSVIPGVFAVNGANFSLEERKVPFDSKTLDITFSDTLDPRSVTPQTVRISPSIAKAKVENGNMIRFSLDTPLEKGETYTIEIGTGVKNMSGKSLGNTLSYIIRAGDRARVTNIFPQGNLENVDQNIIVTFSLPMVSLAKLDTKDTFVCPLTITPTVKGQCKWLNSSTLEYIPEKPLQYATKYIFTVAQTGAFLSPLSDTYTTSLTTPPLKVSVPTLFAPETGIPLFTNAPVTREELEKNIRVFSLSGSTGSEKSLRYTVSDDTSEDNSKSETMFHIVPRDVPLEYGSSYRIEVGSGMRSKYGTEPMPIAFSEVVQTREYLTEVHVTQRIFSTTGTLMDTVFLERDDPYIPVKDLAFDLLFHEEVSLENAGIVFQSDSGMTIPSDLEYGTMQDPLSLTEKIIENKKLIRLIPKIALTPGERYTFTIDKGKNRALRGNIVRSFMAAPRISLALGTVLSNTEVCLYSSSALMNDAQGDISITPNAPLRSLRRDGRDEWDGRLVRTKMRCPVLSGSIASLLALRLNPNTAYTLTFGSGFHDAYGNRLGTSRSFSFTSVDIAPTDRLLYSSYSKDIEVIPSDLPIVMNLLTANLDSVTVDICEMNEKNYIAYMSARFQENFTPTCSKQLSKKIPIKNQYWTLSVNKFDLAQDILGSEIQSPYILVTAYVDGFKNPKNYAEAKKIEHLFIRSNLSLTLERGASGGILFATSFDGKRLPSDLTFEAYESVGEGKMVPMKFAPVWNKEKKFYEITSDQIPRLIFARNAEFFASTYTSYDHVSNYDFRYISGQDSFERDYLYIYSDRPLYKAGDTIYFKGLLRHFSPVGYVMPPEKKGKLQIVDDDWAILYETGIALDPNANFHGSYTLPKDMKQGRYHFQFFTGEGEEATMVYNNGEFYVSDYKKPVFAVDASVDVPDAMLGDRANLNVNAEYYFGGKLPGAKYTMNILTQSYFFDAKEYGQYQFGKGSDYFDCLYWGICQYGDELNSSSSGVLDENGQATLSYTYPETDSEEQDRGEKIYSYTFEVTDPDTEKTVANTVSQILHTTDAYVGIRVPYWTTGKEDIPVEGVILDQSAKGVANKTATVELWKREWKEVKKQGVDGNFYNEMQEDTKKESSLSVTSDAKGEFTTKLKTISGGSYEVRAHYTGKNKQKFTSSSWIYVGGPDERYFEGNNSLTELVADETILRIGDTARFTLQSPVTSGKAFITIEKDDAILDAFTRDLTGASMRIEIPITEKHLPNIYVKVFLIGKNPGDTLPTYRRALSVVKVQTDAQKLNVSVAPDKLQYRPGESITAKITVRDASGKPVPNANGSLAVVDQSLLALAGNPIKNPFAFFYDMKRYLGVETYLSLAYLIEKLEVKDVSGGEKGGAGEKGGLSMKKRGVFKDTAFWLADFTTNSDGTAVITTDVLPDNLTTWVLESIVSTKETNRIGIATAVVRTNKLVMINENLPRFLGSSDTVTLSPVIFNKTNTTQDFTVTLTGTNISGKTLSRVVQIESGASVTVPFEIRVADMKSVGGAPFFSTLSFRAVGKTTRDDDAVEQTLPIILTTTPETVATAGRTEDTLDERISVDENMRSFTGGLIVSYASTLLPNLLSGMDFLTNFSYGCSEQRTSALIPALIMKKVSDRLGIPYDLTKKTIPVYIDGETGYEDRTIDTLIRNYTTDILSFQNTDGGFSYWQKSEESSDYPLTNALLRAFADIRSVGYSLDEKAVNRALTYVKKEFYANKRPYCNGTECGWPNSERLRTIEAILALDPKDYEAYKMYLLIPEKDISFLDAIDRHRVLAGIMSVEGISGKQKETFSGMIDTFIRDALSNSLVVVPRGAYLRSSPYDRVTVNARFLELLSHMGYTSQSEYRGILDQIERWLISQKQSDGSFGSTAQSVEVLRALLSNIIQPSEMDVSLALDSTEVMKTNITGSGKYESFSGFISLSALRSPSILTLTKQGSGTLFYDLSLSYMIPASQITSRDEGFFIHTEYYDYDAYLRIASLKKEEWEKYLSGLISVQSLQYQKSIESYLTPLSEFTVGKLVYVSNHIITGESRDRIAFEGFIPAGTELVDTNLKTENMKNRQDSFFEHTEWRDDRYFGYSARLDAGEYRFSYLLRPTHAGDFAVRPSRIFEFYNPEVFGRSLGKTIRIVDGGGGK